MKKTKKTITIIGVGVLLVLIGFALGARLSDFREMDLDILKYGNNENYNYEDESSEGERIMDQRIDLNGVKKIYIKSKVAELSIVGKESATELSYFTENIKEKYFSVEKKGNEIILEDETPSRKFFGINLGKDQHSKIEVEIPLSVFEEINIEAGVGLTTLKNINSDNFVLKSGVGEVDIDRLKINKSFDINAGVGEVDIKNSDVNDMQVKTGIGEFNFSGKINGDTEIKAGMGECHLTIYGNIDDYDIQAKSGIGEVSINGEAYFHKHAKSAGNPGAKLLKLSGGIGEISVRFKEAK